MKFPEMQLPKEKVGAFYGILEEMRAIKRKAVLDRCMHTSGGCKQRPIASHLLARSWLEQIADKTNHVLQLQLSTENICNEPAQIVCKKLGINLATTFPGFCEEHDNELFACLERRAFVASCEQLSRLRYRSLCREACAKFQIVHGNLARALNVSTPPHVTAHVVAEMKRCLLLLDEIRAVQKNSEKDDVRSYVVKFSIKPTVLGSATIHPLLTFTGRILQFRPEWLTITILPSEDRGWAVFSWSKRAPKNSELVVKTFQALPRHKQTEALLNLVFEASENHAISPDWWNSLNPGRQQSLLKRFGRIFAARPEYTIPAKVLAASEKPWIDWRPVESYYVDSLMAS